LKGVANTDLVVSTDVRTSLAVICLSRTTLIIIHAIFSLAFMSRSMSYNEFQFSQSSELSTMSKITIRIVLFYLMLVFGLISLVTVVALYFWPHGQKSGKSALDWSH
jgi:hypothetical protein